MYIRQIGALFLTLTMLVVSTPGGYAQATTAETKPSWDEAIAAVSPAVVHIVTEVGSKGSGVIFNSQGYILTVKHFAAGSYTAKATLPDGRKFHGKVVNYDQSRDLAVIKISGANLPVAALGDSDQLQIGEEMVALGYALDLPGAQTVTKGIVSAFRQIDGARHVQTDTALNPGNSGCPLINIRGEVVAIHRKGRDWEGRRPVQGISFSIVINEAEELISKVMAGEVIAPPAVLSQLSLVKPGSPKPATYSQAFATGTPKICCQAKVFNAPQRTKVQARWVAIHAAEMRNIELARESLQCEGTRLLSFYLTAPEGKDNFPSGSYSVSLYLNDEQVAILYFKVVDLRMLEEAPLLSGLTLSKSFTQPTKPANITHCFAPNTAVICCCGHYGNAAPGRTKLKVEWVAVITNEWQNVTLMETSFTFGSERGDTLLSFPVEYLQRNWLIDKWPMGRYSITLYVDGEKAASLYFKVEAK